MKLIIGMVQTGIREHSLPRSLTDAHTISSVVLIERHDVVSSVLQESTEKHGYTGNVSPTRFQLVFLIKRPIKECADAVIFKSSSSTCTLFLRFNDFFSLLLPFLFLFLNCFLHSTTHSILHLIFNTCRRFSPSVPFSLPTLQTIK